MFFVWKNAYSRCLSDMIRAMSDILADYREWIARQEERIGTHSDGCHLWPRHERCMIHRLAAELEQTREAIRRLAEQDATLSVQGGSVTVTMAATLTDAERASLTRVIETLEGVEYIEAFATENDATAATILRGLLTRHDAT